ncbi:MAG TPA: M48 family metalloprotease [Coleofasciculaceae cyanobacterium]
MKLLWNSLLISLGILLPTSTSIVLAESLKTPESATLTAGTSELLPVSDSDIPVANEISAAPSSDVKAMPQAQITLISADAVATEEALLTKRPETIVIPPIVEARPTGATAKSAVPTSASPDTVKTIVISEAAPVSTPSAPTAPETKAPAKTDAPENAPTTTAPTEKDSTTGTQAPAKTDAPENTPTTTAPTEKDSTTGTQAPAKTDAPENTPTTTAPTEKDSTETKEPELSPEEIARQQKLIEADNLYKNGQIAEAQQLYREAKNPFGTQAQTKAQAEPFTDPTKLSPAGGVYWRQSQEGLEQKLETKIMVPLELLVEQHPEFIPGHLRYAQVLKEYKKPEEALQVLERAAALYPNQPDLLKAKIAALGEREKWLEASLAARQFALLYPDNPLSSEFTTLADENLERYRSHTRRKLRGNAIANAITGALGFVLTGNLFGPISTVESTVLLLRGESAVGESVGKRAKRYLPMVEDEEVLNYVREVGNKLATVAGRNDFKYEFNVVMDDKLNAFALPGGKVFVNAGAILKTNSEAELAGLLAHELSHAVLSHGFQLVTQGNLTANVTQFVPYGGLLGNLLVLDYSRDMERQADALGTRILASSGYAADGMRNLMVTLDKQEGDRPSFSWLSTHPDSDERISNLETLIERNSYNRYAYEGVARHLEMQKRVRELLRQYEERKERKED